MLHLHVDNTEQSDATVAVRWCISNEDLKELKERRVHNPLVFISITHDGKEAQRVLVPMKQAMTYIQLRQSGRHHFRAFIVWAFNNNHHQEDKMHNILLSRPNKRDYEHSLYDYNDNFHKGWLTSYTAACFIDSESHLEINVGTEFFAPEPWAWEKWWVNLCFEHQPQDQCSFRRRRFVAYTIQPPFVLLFILANIVIRTTYAIMSLLVGIRNVDVRPILRPFEKDTRDICPNVYSVKEYFSAQNNFFLTNKHGHERSTVILLIHPLFLFTFVTMVYFINFFNSWRATGIGIGVSIATTGTLVVFKWCLDKWSERHNSPDTRKERFVKAEEVLKEKALMLEREIESTLTDIVCDGSTLPAKLEALPESKRTLWLKLQQTKARVCRPYSRG